MHTKQAFGRPGINCSRSVGEKVAANELASDLIQEDSLQLRKGAAAFAFVVARCGIVLLFVAQPVWAAAQASDQQPAANAPETPGGRGAAGRGGRGGGAGGGGGSPAYPTRLPADSTLLAHGKQIFSANCAFCHGAEATGGETGPNLIVSQLVLDDQHGELIAPVVQNGRPDKGMPKFDLSIADISAVADFIHSFPTRGGFGGGIVSPANPVVGDSAAGKAYFNGAGKCNTCHSVTGDLAGIGAKYDSRTLQGAILSGTAGGGRGGGGRSGAGASGPLGRTVTVTLPSGQKVDGKLIRIDFFIVSLTDSDGNYQTFRRDGDTPKVDIHDPLQVHKDKLATYSDSDIHNLTAYLVTLK